MQKEFTALQDNHTWDMVALPKHKKAIGCKWVYKVKLKADGSVERLKARLLAKGFTHKYGLDYKKNLLPSGKNDNYKVLTLCCSLSSLAPSSVIHQQCLFTWQSS